MEFIDDVAPVYVPDFNPIDTSDSEMSTENSSSNLSMSTITSDEVAGYFRSVNGFLFAADENVPALLPAHPDTIQMDLLIHAIIQLSLGGQNVPPEAAREFQACQTTGGARVLNLMTGSGIWVRQMAEEYSNATFLSIDNTPLIAHQPHPRIVFEVYDVYAGIAEPDGSFDVVYAIGCVTKTRDFNFILREMHRVLKPNGMLLLMELPIQSFEAERLSGSFHSSPNQANMIQRIRQACEMQGLDLAAWGDMPDRLSPSHPLWKERSIDSSTGIVESARDSDHIRGFHSIVEHAGLARIGPGPEAETERRIGSAIKHLYVVSRRIMVPLITRTGMEQADASNLVDGTLQDLCENNMRGYVKPYCWSAQKLSLCP